MNSNDIIDMVNDLLDEQGEVSIGNLTFYPSQILKQCDPLAYRITVNEYIDNMISDLEYDLERLDNDIDGDEILDIKERLAELEDSYI